MSDILRFILRIDASWLATIECPAATADWAEKRVKHRQLERLTLADSTTTLPKPTTDLHDPLPDEDDDLVTAAATGELSLAFNSIVTRDQAQVARFGHYLFHAVIGWDAWAAMLELADKRGATVLELAIALPSADRDLQRLNWELMHSGKAFLAAGDDSKSVAITRVVGSASPAPDPLDSPPRYLWVIGTALTEEAIRPGAELMGLLRQVKGQRPMNTRILERATPAGLRAVIATFDPEIVHFVCHGGIDAAGVAFLDLQQEEGDTPSTQTAEALIANLRRRDGKLPRVVILSACSTASGGGTERFVLGPREMAPMAVQFVEAGVPIVVGMSGRVGDRTCRLFTRQFGASVIAGERIVDAIAIARRAAFADLAPPSTSVDWALPTLYLASEVPPDYVPIPKGRDHQLWLDIDGWIRDSRLAETPVFCGRQSFFGSFRGLYWTPGERAPDSQVLAIKASGRGYGSKRLLQELAIAAIWDGRLPVLVNAPPRQSQTATWKDFVRVLWSAISGSHLRDDGPTHNLQLGALLDFHSGLSESINQLVMAASGDKLHPMPVAQALRDDLDDLVADAKAAHPHFRGKEAQAIVLLDDIDRWGPAVAQNLFERANDIWDPMLGDFGFGLSDAPIPVVLSFSPTEPLEGVLRDIGSQELAKTWLNLLELGPFAPGEDMLAYRWVLLNPARTAPGQIYGSAWTFADHLTTDEMSVAEGRFRAAVKGVPGEMALATGALYVTAEEARRLSELVSANDEDALKLVPHGHD